MRKWHRTLLILCGVMGGLLAGEGAARLYFLLSNSSDHLRISANPRMLVEPEPSVTYRSRTGQRVRVNQLGLKGEEISPRKPGEFRILAVGDSIMAGEYLPEEERLPNLLARRLAQSTAERVLVWNAAVGGYNVWQVLATLESKAPRVDPDLVLIGVCANDYIPFKNRAYRIGGRVFIVGRDGSIARHLNFLYQRSDLYKWGYDKLREVVFSRLIAEEGYAAYLQDYAVSVDSAHVERWKEALEQMVKIAKGLQAKPVFIFFPLHPQVYRGEEAMNRRLVSWAEEKHYSFVDLTGVFRKEDPTGMSLYRERDVVHPNGRGFHIAAESLYEVLQGPHRMGGLR
ncbi:MAG: SGNH/GDSL hydrolase family protein [Candidatus Omnitrophica bacterium]|nr:SGNH/GDSL hydrolase family protein [Candidatus Omnitrophota bacterium]